MKKESLLGRLRGTKTEPMSIRLSAELMKRVKKVTKTSGHTSTAVVEWCLEQSLSKLEGQR